MPRVKRPDPRRRVDYAFGSDPRTGRIMSDIISTRSPAGLAQSLRTAAPILKGVSEARNLTRPDLTRVAPVAPGTIEADRQIINVKRPEAISTGPTRESMLSPINIVAGGKAPVPQRGSNLDVTMRGGIPLSKPTERKAFRGREKAQVAKSAEAQAQFTQDELINQQYGLASGTIQQIPQEDRGAFLGKVVSDIGQLNLAEAKGETVGKDGLTQQQRFDLRVKKFDRQTAETLKEMEGNVTNLDKFKRGTELLVQKVKQAFDAGQNALGRELQRDLAQATTDRAFALAQAKGEVVGSPQWVQSITTELESDLAKQQFKDMQAIEELELAYDNMLNMTTVTDKDGNIQPLSSVKGLDIDKLKKSLKEKFDAMKQRVGSPETPEVKESAPVEAPQIPKESPSIDTEDPVNRQKFDKLVNILDNKDIDIPPSEKLDAEEWVKMYKESSRKRQAQ